MTNKGCLVQIFISPLVWYLLGFIFFYFKNGKGYLLSFGIGIILEITWRIFEQDLDEVIRSIGNKNEV